MNDDAIKNRYWVLLVVGTAALLGLLVRFSGPSDNYKHNRSHFYDKTYVPQGTLE